MTAQCIDVPTDEVEAVQTIAKYTGLTADEIAAL